MVLLEVNVLLCLSVVCCTEQQAVIRQVFFMAEIFIELSSTESLFGLFADLLCGVKSFGSKFQKESKGKGKKQKKEPNTHTKKRMLL